MHYLVIGASGRSGQLVIEEALRKGHSVTALVRTPESLPSADISKAIAANTDSAIDAVLFTMASRRVSDNPFAAPHPTDFQPLLLSDSARNAMAAMRAASPPVKKIVFMSSVGTGESYVNVNFLMRFMFSRTNMRYSREDHDAAYQELREAKDITYVSVRPWMLADGEAQHVKVYPDDGSGAGFMPKISRSSVAAFMVQAAETSEYDGRAPVITN
ncbi:hypothetical protein NLU13_0776 [Sarocladium strictum]|uniref:NAD(P)-binding domain-containing protein n=1 Tax=Sarocladium strictum TaxID=5046 RepID=A0AA39GPP0_SARSR|nr:hypothetical protein NLU13_0776 [Sarocladium strictum]